MSGLKTSADAAVPLPNKRTIRGGPLNAQKSRVIRPFSRTCETVSMPVPNCQDSMHQVSPVLEEKPTAAH